MTILKDMNELNWVEVCALDDITPNTGVGALIENQQIALFRVGHEKRVYALSNQDPFSKAFVMSRGILGDLQGERVVASPIYKQHFSLATGRCLEDKDQKLLVFPSKIENGKVWISPTPQKTYITNNGISQEKMKLVLVGNGLAGMRCLEDLLDMAPDRYEITVIGEEPLWGQAFICASHLAEHGSLTFKAPTVPTQLKVSGCDVFSAGDFEPKEDFEDIVLNDEKRQIYKRIIIQKDRVIGAVLFGDTEDGAWYAELIADQTPIATIRNKLLFGRDFALKKAG